MRSGGGWSPACVLQSRAAMKLSTVLATLAVSGTALAGNPPSGHWRMTVDGQYPGDLYLAPVGDHVCAYYRYDNHVSNPGVMTLKVDRDSVSGTYDETIANGKIRWKLAGKELAGHYTDSHDENPQPWVARFVGAESIRIEKTYDVAWTGDAVHSTIHFTQSGNNVVGVVNGHYSGDETGTIIGVMYGELLAGVYVRRKDTGNPPFRIVLMQFEKPRGSRTYDSIHGLYSDDMSSCEKNGEIIDLPTK